MPPPITSGLQVDLDGSVAPTVVGGFVTVIPDQSGNVNNVTIAAANKPVWNGEAILLPPNLAKSTVNLPASVSINSQSFSLFIVGDVLSSRMSNSGNPTVGNSGTMGSFGAQAEALEGIASDTNNQRSIRSFVNVLSGTLTINGWHQGQTILGLAGSNARHRFFAAEQTASVAAALAANTRNGLNIGGNFSTIWAGGFKRVLLYDRDLTDGETDTILAYLRTTYDLPATKTYVWACDGDSLTYGTGLELTTMLNYIRQLDPAIYNACKIYNFGVPGQTVANMVTGQADVDAVYDATKDRNILTVFNADITNEAGQRAYCLARVATGYEVFLGTPIAGNFGGGYDAAHLVYGQSLIAAPPAGVTVVKLGQDPRLSDYNNTTYYQSDKIHLTEAGEAVVLELFQEAAFPEPPPPVPPIGTPLLPCQCVAGMTVQYQMAYIYEALKQLAGSPADLPDFQCVLGSPQQSQFAYIYCATLAWQNS